MGETDAWEDEERMAGLMSMFKRRDVNPHDWDAKMKYWTERVEQSAADAADALVSARSLSARFRRGDRLPAGLATVLTHLQSSGRLRAAADVDAADAGWLAWGVDALVTRPLGWLLGRSAASAPSDEYVLTDLLNKQCDRLLDMQRNETESDGVLTLRQLHQQTKDICATERNLELALKQLARDRQVTVAISSDGEKIVKFRDQKDTGPVRVTEADSGIHNLKKAAQKLEDELIVLEKRVNWLMEEARQHVRSGNQSKAKQMLRKKQLVAKQIKDKEASYNNMMGLMHKLAETRDQKEVLDAYKAGVSAFKANLRQHGLSPQDIDDTMESIQEALSDHEDISMAMSQGPSGRADASDAELEKELDDLLQEKRPRIAAEFPSVPEEPPTVAASSAPRGDRLADLRRQLEEAR